MAVGGFYDVSVVRYDCSVLAGVIFGTYKLPCEGLGSCVFPFIHETFEMNEDTPELEAPTSGEYTPSAEEERHMLAVRQMMESRSAGRQQKVLRKVRMRRKRRPLKCTLYRVFVWVSAVTVLVADGH